MIFDDLQNGETVFIDANVLIYHFEPHPVLEPVCTKLLNRIENQELVGYTSSHLLGEMIHRLMTLEAKVSFGWPIAGIGNRLRTNPTEVKKLSLFRTALDKVIRGRIQVLPISHDILIPAAELCQMHGLLTNDGIVVAVMQAHNLTRVASADDDFDRVPGLVRYAPA